MQARLLWPLFVVALVISAWSPQVGGATVTQISNTFYIVHLPATIDGWQSTGVTICPDSRWSIQAQGLASYENDAVDPAAIALRWHGPGGQLSSLPRGECLSPSVLVDGAPNFSLVGQIGTTPFYVGEGGEFAGSAGAPGAHPIGDGLLSFAFNDCYYLDNDGFFVIYLNYLSGSCPPVAVESVVQPATTKLSPGIPNPTQSRAEFVFETHERATYTVSVLDVAGRLIREIYRGLFEPGTHTVQWDGSDADGRRVAAGTYFCVVNGAGKDLARKVVVVH